MKKNCAQCGATNPPPYNFCSQCGHNLATSGAIALARSGLIAEIDEKAAALLGYYREEMAGKPFSLFVAREDLAVFFSHWNELFSTFERQSIELALKHKNGKKIYLLIEYALGEKTAPLPQLIHLSLSDVNDRRLALEQLRYQQDLLHLIYALADNVRTVSGPHLDATIAEALEKICLFTKADRCFICGINRNQKRLDVIHQWCRPSCSAGSKKSRSVPLNMVKRCIVRMSREHAYIVNDVSKLSTPERYELTAWYRAVPGAVMCHLIYARKRPIGIIGVVRNESDGQWRADSIALVKLFAQLVSDLLPLGTEGKKDAQPKIGLTAQKSSGRRTKTETPGAIPGGNMDRLTGRTPETMQHRTKTSNRKSTPAVVKPLPDVGKPMQFEKITAQHELEHHKVFPRDDGQILLTCPYCGIQESVSMVQFDKLGNAVTVICSCRKRFAAVLEKRRSYRKSVRLDGYFAVTGEFAANEAKISNWDSMVVKNLSKTGLRFCSKRVDFIRPGDHLMVRFNLDNSNHDLIVKKAQVVSINNNEVGCRFKGADQFDITLGLYFI